MYPTKNSIMGFAFNQDRKFAQNGYSFGKCDDPTYSSTYPEIITKVNNNSEQTPESQNNSKVYLQHSVKTLQFTKINDSELTLMEKTIHKLKRKKVKKQSKEIKVSVQKTIQIADLTVQLNFK